MKLDFWAGVSFYRDLDLMVWQPRGVLDDAHVDRLIDMIEQAEKDADPPFNRYTDLSKLDAVGLSFDYVFRVSLYRRITYGDQPAVKSAFYVTNRLTAEVALTHAVVAKDSPLIVKVFLDRSKAADWLGVGEYDLELDR
jgi:hypothetical protein